MIDIDSQISISERSSGWATNYLVAISVNDVVPSGSFVVDEELDGGHRLDFAQLREQFLAFWTGNCGHQGGGGWLLQ